MNINDVLKEMEYTKGRPAKKLFEWFTLKNEELKAWSYKHKKIKYKELSKGLPGKFLHELMPFAYYAKNYYDDVPDAIFKPCCGSEQYDGIIIDNDNAVFVEFTNAIFGDEWSVIKEVLAETGVAPWEYDILGVNKKNRAKKKKAAMNIFTDDETEEYRWQGANNVIDCVNELKELVKRTADAKFKKSLDILQPYGQNKTILIVTFDDTFIRQSVSCDRWEDFVNFKRTEVDSMKHNFRNVVLFGWLDKKFID